MLKVPLRQASGALTRLQPKESQNNSNTKLRHTSTIPLQSHRSSLFEGRQSFQFMQLAAAQGHPRAAVCLALATLFAAQTDLDKRGAFTSMLRQVVIGRPSL
jgi:hypothetical protein